ncbi:MAG: hypothetical protein KatS3mg010_0943 [Acidimicrobiia bacterium]|nr:MAG: hypothetical protein KatS3mg010_0943 [Acidimicrobiia bacterium]
MPLRAAEKALLHERRRLTREEALAVAHLPLDELPSLVALAHKVRMEWCGPAVELESLINAKSGACPEDCAFCSQSVRYSTGVDVYPFLDVDEILAAAHATRAAGATQFCIVVAVRGPEERLLRRVLDAVDAVRRETGLEVACSLGLLTAEQAERLAAAGVRRYNHNLETCRARFPEVCTTHTYDDRVETARLARAAGMELCCGGILGMGETLEERVDFAFELAELGPCEVPINLLDPRPGTPFEGRPTLDPTRGAPGDRVVPPDPPRCLAAPRGRARARARRAAGHGAPRGSERVDRRQLPHDDRPLRRRGPCAPRGARHAGRRGPRRGPLRGRRDGRARAARAAGAPLDPGQRAAVRCAVSL